MPDLMEILIEVLKQTIIPALPDGYEKEQAVAMVAVLRTVSVDKEPRLGLARKKTDLLARGMGEIGHHYPAMAHLDIEPGLEAETALQRWNTRLSLLIQQSCSRPETDQLKTMIRQLLREQINLELSRE